MDNESELVPARVSRRLLLGGGASLAATATGLSSCSSNSGGSGSAIKIGLSQFKADDGLDPTTGRQVKGINTLLKSFMKDNPKIDVHAIDVVGSGANATNAKIQTLLLSGGVDIIESATLWPFYKQGLMADLTSYYKKDNWAKNYIPALFSEPMERLIYPPWVWPPQHYTSVPAELDTLSLAYDKQIFQDFGVEPLSAVPSVDEIIQKAPKLTGVNPRTGKQNYAMFYDPRGQSHIMLYYFGHGIDFGKIDCQSPSDLTFDTPRVKGGIEQMIKISRYLPPGYAIGNGNENWGTKDNTVAINLSVAPQQMLPAVQNNLVDRFIVTEGVRNSDGHTFFISALEYGVSKKAKNLDAIWEVLKFLSGAPGQKFLYENYGYLPSWTNADWVKTADSPYAKEFLSATKVARNAFFPEFMFKTFRPWMASVISKAVNNESYNLDRGLADMQKKAEQWVKSEYC